MSSTQVDLRAVKPHNRESELSTALHRLPAGGALELISDVDPNLLRTQFTLPASIPITWGTHTQQDGAWHVRIVKNDAGGCCGGCACD